MLPDKELDRLAAERITGWPVLCLDDPDREVETWPCLYETNDGTGWVVMTGPEPATDWRPWAPSTDWSAAGEIVDVIGARGWELAMHTKRGTPDSLEAVEFSCSFGNLSPAHRRRCGSAFVIASGPRAITIAALRAVGALEAE